MAGISSLHGPHHIAQRLRKTTLPLSSARLSLPPSRAAILKSLACCWRLGLMRSRAWAGSSAALAGIAAQTRTQKRREASRHMDPEYTWALPYLTWLAFVIGYRGFHGCHDHR